MASFFQFSLGSPYIDPGSRFIHFQKPPVVTHTLGREWWHVALLLLGACTVFAGCVLQIVLALRGRGDWSQKIISAPLQWSQHVQKAFDACLYRWKAKQPLETDSKRPIDATYHGEALSNLAKTPSFCITASGQCDSSGCGMHIRSDCDKEYQTYVLSGQATRQSNPDRAIPAPAALSNCASKVSTFLACFDMQCLKNEATLQGELQKVAFTLNAWRLERGFAGFVIRCGQHDNPATVSNLLLELRRHSGLLVLRTDADSSIWKNLDFGFLDGILLENACILPSGERRDFFRASRVRECAAYCKQQRIDRPDFFFGFIEVWRIDPSAATLRRAYKLADFFGAIVLATPADLLSNRAPTQEMPLSGFDWLKKPDVVWLQKAWTSHTKFLLTEEPDHTPFHIGASSMLEALPAADRMLAIQPVHPNAETLAVASYSPRWVPPSVPNPPSRVDIWHFASCGTKLCPTGCFSLRQEIVQSQHDAVLTIQKSLKHNQLLRTYGEADNLRVRDSLSMLRSCSSYPDFVQNLLQGLANQEIRIFAGLDSGFTLPDEGGHLWAVADTTPDKSGCLLDIHISLKVANDVSTIWHTFLAYNGVPRLQRYEEELLLDLTPETEQEKQLPLSIIKDLEESSESELLYLFEQIKITECDHSFNRAILKVAERLLIQDVTGRAWSALHSTACLDGSVSVESLLEQRIAHFTNLGATLLPTVENLVRLHELLQDKLQTALRTCDRATLDMLTNPLLVKYGQAGSEHAVPPSVDLYGLIFFCALRRLAFENVYLETTDRCPLFLLQPDQAGVFAELWVLGSQCEIYFGVSPRTLGDIAYNKYQLFLSHNPPPETAWDDKEVFTAYSVPEISDKVPAAVSNSPPEGMSSTSNAKKSSQPRRIHRCRDGATTAGALSIFCFPAIIDVILLTFLGRGLYLTAFMNDEFKLMADYAIMTALIMTGGITGLVGSTGGYYLFNVSS
jgi:hypothetical protein